MFSFSILGSLITGLGNLDGPRGQLLQPGPPLMTTPIRPSPVVVPKVIPPPRPSAENIIGIESSKGPRNFAPTSVENNPISLLNSNIGPPRGIIPRPIMEVAIDSPKSQKISPKVELKVENKVENNVNIDNEEFDKQFKKQRTVSPKRTMKRPTARDMSRPVPPVVRPPGIPDGQSLPPIEEPNEDKHARALRPLPTQLPPNSLELIISNENKEIVNEIIVPNPNDAPFKRGKKPKVIVIEKLKRRDRLQPEFESSSDEEEDKKDFLERAVIQVKPPLADIDQMEAAAKHHLETFEFIKPKEADDENLIENELPIEYDEDGLEIISNTISTNNNILMTARDSTKSMKSKKFLFDNSEPLMNDLQVINEDDPGFISSRNNPNQNMDLIEKLNQLDEIESISLINASENNNRNIILDNIPLPLEKHNLELENSKLAKLLPNGRLNIKLYEGTNIRRKDDYEYYLLNDTFIRLKLGSSIKTIWKSSKIHRKQNNHPTFDEEIISFDITDLRQYINNSDLQLIIEINHHGINQSENMGYQILSVIRFFQQPFQSFIEIVPLKYYNDENNEHNCTSKIKLEFLFEEARSGLFIFKLYEAINLRIIDPLGRQDPFVQIALSDNYIKNSEICKNGLNNPYFYEEEILLWIDQVNWINDIHINLLDVEYGPEKPIGSTYFSLLPYMKNRPEDAIIDNYDLFYMKQIDKYDETKKQEIAEGYLSMKVTYLTAGKLTVLIVKAVGLQFPSDYIGTVTEMNHMDAFVSLGVDGKAVNMIKRTPLDKDGGNEPM